MILKLENQRIINEKYLSEMTEMEQKMELFIKEKKDDENIIKTKNNIIKELKMKLKSYQDQNTASLMEKMSKDKKRIEKSLIWHQNELEKYLSINTQNQKDIAILKKEKKNHKNTNERNDQIDLNNNNNNNMTMTRRRRVKREEDILLPPSTLNNLDQSPNISHSHINDHIDTKEQIGRE